MSLPHKNNRITLSGIAKSLNLATSTVSFCLSGKAAQYGIKPETEKMVCSYAAKVGYIANSAARQLRGTATPPVGLLFDPRINTSELPMRAMDKALQMFKQNSIEARIVAADLFSGLIQLRELNCCQAIVFSVVTEAPGSKAALERTLENYQAAASGIKLYCVNYGFHQQETPLFPDIVRLGIHRHQINLALTEYLLKLDPGSMVMQSTWGGLSDSEYAGNLYLLQRNEHADPYLQGRIWAQEYLAIRNRYRISAIMPGDDRISAGVISELLANNVQIPQDVRIISFDNLDFSGYLPIPLTTWGVPVQKHVQMVLDCLLNHTPIPPRLVSKPEFSWRQSCGFTPAEQQEFEKHISVLCDKLNN